MSKPGLAARLREAFLADLEEQLGTLNGALLALELDARSTEGLKSVFRVMHTLKGAAHATDQPLVERACHGLEATLVEAREGRLLLGPVHFELLFSAADALADAARRIATGEVVDENTPIGRLVARLEGSAVGAPEAVGTANPSALAEPSGPSEPGTGDTPAAVPAAPNAEVAVRVAADKLDALLAHVGRLLAARARIAEHAVESAAIQDRVHEAHAVVRRMLALHSAHLPAEVANELRSVELTLRETSSRTGAVAAHGIEDGRALAEVGDALSDSVRRVRMLPFSSACDSLPRLVRDVAADTGKPSRLAVQGGDIEADRPVLDALKDSLLHLVRNAIDHGVEGPADRTSRGKPALATISVRAALHGERLTVTVSDDGGGLDIAAIRRKLAARGLPVPDADAEVAHMLFQAGFSTREVATTISGRGVGLDAVEAAMLRVRGTVEVSWEAGVGTTFTLQCPLTLAAIRAVLVRSGRRCWPCRRRTWSNWCASGQRTSGARKVAR